MREGGLDEIVNPQQHPFIHCFRLSIESTLFLHVNIFVLKSNLLIFIFKSYYFSSREREILSSLLGKRYLVLPFILLVRFGTLANLSTSFLLRCRGLEVYFSSSVN